MKKKSDFYGIVRGYIPIVLLVIGVSLVTSSYKGGGGGGGGSSIPKCEKNGEIDVILSRVQLSYDNLYLEIGEKNMLMMYHGSSPISSLSALFSNQTEYLVGDQRPKLEVIMSADNCSGKLETVFRSRTDFEYGNPGISNIKIGYHEGANVINVSVKVISAELSYGGNKKLIWAKTAPTSFFENFNLEAGILKVPALMQYSGSDGGSSTCSGNCRNWNNGDVYVDGAIDEEMVWDGDVGCTC